MSLSSLTESIWKGLSRKVHGKNPWVSYRKSPYEVSRCFQQIFPQFPGFSSANRWASAEVSPRAASKMTWKITCMASASGPKMTNSERISRSSQCGHGMSEHARIYPHLISTYHFFLCENMGKWLKVIRCKMINRWIWGGYPYMFKQRHDVQSMSKMSKPTETAATESHRCSSYTDLRSAHKWLIQNDLWHEIQVKDLVGFACEYVTYANRNGKCLVCQVVCWVVHV